MSVYQDHSTDMNLKRELSPHADGPDFHNSEARPWGINMITVQGQAKNLPEAMVHQRAKIKFCLKPPNLLQRTNAKLAIHMHKQSLLSLIIFPKFRICKHNRNIKLPVPTQQLTALRTKERISLALNRYLIATCTLVNQ